MRWMLVGCCRFEWYDGGSQVCCCDCWSTTVVSVAAWSPGLNRLMCTVFILWPSIIVTSSGKTDHVGTTSEMHFVAPYHRYIHTLLKHSDNITRSGQVCFSMWLFLGRAKHWKASTDGEGPLGGSYRTAWTQIVSYTLASSSVMVCDWCGGLFGIWLERCLWVSFF